MYLTVRKGVNYLVTPELPLGTCILCWLLSREPTFIFSYYLLKYLTSSYLPPGLFSRPPRGFRFFLPCLRISSGMNLVLSKLRLYRFLAKIRTVGRFRNFTVTSITDFICNSGLEDVYLIRQVRESSILTFSQLPGILHL